MSDWLALLPVWEAEHVSSQSCMGTELLKESSCAHRRVLIKLFLWSSKSNNFIIFFAFIVCKDWAIWMVYSGFKLCSFVLVPKWISCLFSTGSSLSFTHFPSLCLTGAFSARLEFVNSQNTAPGWLTKCVWFLLKSMHWEHLRETDRETVRARKKKKKKNRGWLREREWKGKLAFGWAVKRYSLQCVPFPSMEASSSSAASVGRQRQKERWWYEGEGDGRSCLEQHGNGGEKKKRRKTASGRIKSKLQKKKCFICPGSLSDNKKNISSLICVQYITRKSTDCLKARLGNFWKNKYHKRRSWIHKQ